MNHGPRAHDPTARAAIQPVDAIGLALATLSPGDAQLLVAHDAFQVPVAALVRALTRHDAYLPDYDWGRLVRSTIRTARRQVREHLTKADPDELNEEIDWSTSPAVAQIGNHLGVNRIYPCAHCAQVTVPAFKPTGRPRSYCSNACRQAAYRKRRGKPA